MAQIEMAERTKAADDLLDALRGRIRDSDSHEMYPAVTWVAEYGEAVAPLADIFLQNQSQKVPNSFSVDVSTDDGVVSEESVAASWGAGCRSVGAFDMRKRLDVMDLMGVRDCLLFGSVMAIYGHQMATTGGDQLAAQYGEEGAPSGDRTAAAAAIALGKAALRAHNDWCLRTTAISPRLRPVGTILTGTLDEALAEARRLIEGGVRAIAVPAGQTIGGKAPANPGNDPLWALFTETRTALVFHVGGDSAFRREATGWTDTPHFASNNSVPTEIPIDPFSMATSHYAVQNYLTNLILGAVFERFPDLRCGVMEYSGYWIGPMAENLDLWVEQFAGRFAKTLTMKPSEYVHRNIRVSPFDFEPVDAYVDRHPYLEDVFCFATDYPHYEGGQDPRRTMIARMERFGREAIEKLFVGNAGWIMPD
jgi:predicted TIM-barrel fold metal-dependent hydrolase